MGMKESKDVFWGRDEWAGFMKSRIQSRFRWRWFFFNFTSMRYWIGDVYFHSKYCVIRLMLFGILNEKGCRLEFLVVTAGRLNRSMHAQGIHSLISSVRNKRLEYKITWYSSLETHSISYIIPKVVWNQSTLTKTRDNRQDLGKTSTL